MRPGRLGKRKRKRCVAQVSKPAVSPTSQSAGRAAVAQAAGLETRDTADLEVCATLVSAMPAVSVYSAGFQPKNHRAGRTEELRGFTNENAPFASVISPVSCARHIGPVIIANLQK